MRKQKKPTKIEPKFYVMIDKEEIYLNEMCRKGWKPTEIFLGIFFVFEKCEPGEYIARVTTAVDADSGKATKEKRRLLTEYLTDSGAEIVHETNIDADTRIYAIRPAALGAFDINTDTDSLMADYCARRKFYAIWAVIAGLMALVALLLGVSFAWEAKEMGEASALRGACMEFVCAAGLLLLLIALIIPIGKYNRRLRELRRKRELEE